MANGKDELPPPLMRLWAKIETAKAAPLLHKGEAANEALDEALAVVMEHEKRLEALEARLNAITHPEPQLSRASARPPRRDASGKFA